MEQFTKFVALDTHKATLMVATADRKRGADVDGEARAYGEIPNTPEALHKLVLQLRKTGAKLVFCYEAGPCGYGIHRQLKEMDIECQVVAPSLIPRKAGDRVKTDRRDALMLARLLRAGELTPVWVPDDAQEGLRDLTRAREDLKGLQLIAKQNLSALLLRYGKSYPGKSNWTQAHFRWLEEVKFTQPLQQIVFQECVETVKMLTKRVAVLDEMLDRASAGSMLWPWIEALMALRGLSLLSATTVMAELGDLRRFNSAPQLMAYLGLVPSEHSSGAKKSRGGITKTGNAHVRRVLVEAAWTYRFKARKTAHLQRRAEKTSEEIQDIAWKAQKRLCERYQSMQLRGKLKVQACTAVARELAGFIWAIGQAMPQMTSKA